MTVTDYDVADEQQDTTPETLQAATLALQVAVDQLTQPGLERLDRSRPEADDAVKTAEAEHTRTAAEELARDEFRQAKLLKQHADFKARGDAVGDRLAQRVRTTLVALRLQMRANADERERRAQARAVTQATLPSLIEQLQDAVQTPRGGGNKAASVHRAAISFEAAELLGHIQRVVHARPEDDLPTKLRGWCDNVVAEQNATTLPDAADHAEAWVREARNVLNPERSFELAAPCPACGNRWTYTIDDLGGRVKKAALQVSETERVARCIHPTCGQRWPETHWPLLIAALNQDREEKAG